ncbi:MAG: hypothetical protein HGA42_00630 [Nostocales cyanobacterium W4_Combined_metabat2_030]|nr:hypothetical protein [Nostocales cyanobacterium W4_Combined_metabat2_030]
MASTSQRTGIIATLGFLGLALGYWIWNNKRKIANLDYSIVKVKLLKMGILNMDVRASILIKNPSSFGVVISNYITQIYHVNPTTKQRTLIVASKPATITLKANDNVINDVDFTLSNIAGFSTLFSILKQPNITSLGGQFAIIIKGDILGNYFEKEIIY